jgi:hypothetical protein
VSAGLAEMQKTLPDSQFDLNADGERWCEVAEESLPKRVSNPQASGVLWEANEQCFLISMPNMARCLVSSDARIQLARADPTSRIDLRWFVQGLPIAAYWVQRRYLTLHAAAVSTSRGAVLFLGHSGAGKSTLAAGLALRNYAILADEAVPIDLFAGPQAMVHPSMSDPLLTDSAIEGLGFDRSKIVPARLNLRRYFVDGLPKARTATSVRAIYILAAHNRPNIEFKVLRGQEKMMAILPYAFNGRLPESSSVQRNRFLRLGLAFADVSVTKVFRPDQMWSGDELLGRLETELSP